MSIIDGCTVLAHTAAEMALSGHSLSKCIYKTPLIICLTGELGAGKTTFVQGIAKGLGVDGTVVSPTYALEQRYGELLSHIDLYRLTEKQAKEFVEDMEPFAGVCAIEWSDRHDATPHDIAMSIRELPDGAREIECVFNDIAVPTDTEIANWIREVALSKHIQKHMETVAEVTEKICDTLQKQGRIVRTKAVRAAAKTHDLLRFVDFQSLSGDEYYQPTKRETETWTVLKAKYGTPHEKAAERFLAERGYPEIGRIVRPHRGYDPPLAEEKLELSTIEQIVLAYADKRVRFDQVVTIDERFDDFKTRYGAGKESEHAKEWRVRMKGLEAELFPNGATF